jgi:hypothetical protein
VDVEVVLRLLGEQRRLQRPAEREREPARAVLGRVSGRRRRPAVEPGGGVVGGVDRLLADRWRAPGAGRLGGAVDLGEVAGSASSRCSARRASSDSTLVVPSQIGSTCASRSSTGRWVSSM